MDVRTITEDEVEPWVSAMRSGFFEHAAEGEAAFRRPAMDLDRTLAGFDGARLVATYRSFPTELTVPGGAALPASAVTNVTVAPTHRRRRLLTEMISRDLTAAKDRGEAVSVLIASEYRIYGRYGFAASTDHVELVARRHAARFRNQPTGSVALVTPEEARPHLRTVYDAHRRQHAGEIDRHDLRLDVEVGLVEHPHQKGPPPFQALCRDDDGQVTGYVRYRVDDNWEGRVSDVTVKLDELIVATPDAAATLWSYCLGMDWVVRVVAPNRGPDDLLPYLLDDARAVQERHRADLLWTRVLDVPTALSSRRYLRDGSLVLEIDDALGLADGRFRLSIDAGQAVTEPTADAADLRVPVDVLSALLLGGASLGRFAEAGRIEEHRPGAVAELDGTFRWHREPWCATWF